MKKLLSMALVLMMICSLFAVPAMAAESIAITEANDYDNYGEVVAEVGTNTIKVVTKDGYYLHSATLNGNPIKGDFVAGYESYSTDTATGYKEKWTYTLTEGTLAAADALVVTYGYYTTETDVYVGGDAESESHYYYKNSTGTAAERTNLEKSTGEYSFKSANRFYAKPISGNRTTFAAGKYKTSFDLKSDDNIVIKIYAPSNSATPMAGYNYVSRRSSSTWKSYTTYFTLAAEQKNDYVYIEHATTPTNGAYYDNFTVKKLAEAGPVLQSYDINVTEVNKHGTVTAPASVYSNATAEIKVVADTGYYVDSITIDGETTAFTEGYEKTATTEEFTYKESWTYTLDGASLTEDADIVVTYAEYTKEELVIGGNAESDVHNVLVGGEATTPVEVPGEAGKHAFVATGSKPLGITRWEIVPDEKYLFTFDAKKTEGNNTPMYMYATGLGLLPNGVEGEGREYATIYPGSWKSFTTILVTNKTKTDSLTCYPMAGSAYVDNFSIVRLTKGPVTPPEPSTYTVTINSDANANIDLAKTVVNAGEATTFTVAPKFGYYIQSITVGGTPIDVQDAYKGAEYTTGNINANTEIVVTIASLADNDKGVSTDIATLPAVFADNETDTAVTFGKVLDNSVEEYGIYLTQGGVGVTTAKGTYGPYFKVTAEKTINGQFAVEFIGLEPGEYTATTYVKVAGVPAYGVATTFTIE